MPDPEPAIPEPTRHPPPGPVARALNLPFLGAIWAYRCTLSPFIGGACRFDPTCSRYALEAFRIHGPWLGVRLTVRRIFRCHPWGGGGYDPVPHNEPPDREDRTGRDSFFYTPSDSGAAADRAGPK